MSDVIKRDIQDLYDNMNLEEIYSAIISNMQDGAYFVDKDRRILFWNDAAEKIRTVNCDCEGDGCHCDK
jgi:PAS domain-containing protein